MNSFLHRLEKIFISTDFLSPTIGFEYNGYNQYKNIAGGLYSFIITGLTIAMTLIFSSDIYLRTNPFIITYEDSNENSEIFIKNFPFTFTLGDNNGLIEEYFKYVNIPLRSFELTKDNSIVIKNYNDILEKCNSSNYEFPADSNISHKFNVNMDGVYCIKPIENLSFKNGFITTNSISLSLRIEYCDPNTSSTCPYDIEKIVSKMSFGIYYMISYPNTPDFNNPIKYRVRSSVTDLSIGLMKRLFISFIKSQYISDDGLIFNANRVIDHVELYSTSSEYILKLDKPDRIVYTITFDSPLVKRVITRKFVKIQDILSNVGGFTTIMIVLLQYLTKSHLRFNYLMFIRNLAIEEDNNLHKVPQMSSFFYQKRQSNFNDDAERSIKV